MTDDHKLITDGSEKQARKEEGQEMKSQKKNVEQLLIHNSDTTVKPIIGNKEIEQIVELKFNSESLKFEVKTPDELVDLIEKAPDQGDIPFLNSLYSAISSNGTVTEKLNILTYFETLITSQVVAN